MAVNHNYICSAHARLEGKSSAHSCVPLKNDAVLGGAVNDEKERRQVGWPGESASRLAADVKAGRRLPASPGLNMQVKESIVEASAPGRAALG